MSQSRDELPYSQLVQVYSIKSDTNLILRPDDETRVRIAHFAGLHSLKTFKAELLMKPRHDGSVLVTGTLEADVEPICVVTLEPFADHVSEEIEATFAPEDVIARLIEKLAAEDDEDSEGTPELPDPIVNGAIDPAALAVEFLILGLDPYPRKPGVDFPEMKVGEEAISPFAVLKALKSDKSE
ncbi:MAG: YceD family protein [Rhabdaerophilum sp.]